jgi:NAD(P)H-dependent flavin oxidoreductase YrpB (nitropropane dioxygenase family)
VTRAISSPRSASATPESDGHPVHRDPSPRERAYKRAIVEAGEADIVHSERITGVPVAVINTPYIRRVGLKAGRIARWMLRGHKTKHWMRSIYALRSIWQLKRASLDESGEKDYWQAGKSVAGIHAIEPAGEIVKRFAAALDGQMGGWADGLQLRPGNPLTWPK